MNKGVLFLLMFGFLFLGPAIAEEIPMTLDEAISVAVRDNRDILLKAEDVKKARAKLKEAKAGLFPALSVASTWQDIRGLYNKDLEQIDSQVSLKQALYQGGKIINTIKQSRYGIEVYESILDKTKSEIILSVKDAFYALLLAQEFAKINKGIVDNTKEHLDFLEARYKEGQASESDILEITASLETVRQAYSASLNQVDAGQVFLANLLYLDKDVKLSPQAQFNYQPQELAYDEAFLSAMRKRPEIRQYEAQEKADKKAIEVAKSGGRPAVYASWNYYSSSTQMLTFAPGRAWQDWNVIGVTFSWPVFDGWATKAKVEQALVDLKETRLLKEKTRSDIALELKNTYLGLKNAIAKIKSTQAEINLYQDIFLATQEKYKKGIASGLALHDVSLGYQIAIFNQKQAVYDYLIAKARFDKAAGGGG